MPIRYAPSSPTISAATAHAKANPNRTAKPSIDWHLYLYKERRQVECFFNKLKRFRRIVSAARKPSASSISLAP